MAERFWSNWNLMHYVMAIILTLIGLQALGLMFGRAIGIDIYLGPIFILLAVGATAATSIAVLKKLLTDDGEVSGKDVFAIVIVAVVSILILFYLKDFVPEIFEQSVMQLQALITP